MKYKNFKISFLILFTVVMTATAQYKEYDSLAYVSRRGGDTLLYRQLNPLQVEDGKKYPLVLFLHGAGERGADNRAQLTHGGMMFTNQVNREKYPAFVLFPQCPSDSYWPAPKRPDGFQRENPFPANAEISRPLALTKELIDKIVDTYPVDENRIYIAGLSMGGWAPSIWFVVSRNFLPQQFPSVAGSIRTGSMTSVQKQPFVYFMAMPIRWYPSGFRVKHL